MHLAHGAGRESEIQILEVRTPPPVPEAAPDVEPQSSSSSSSSSESDAGVAGSPSGSSSESDVADDGYPRRILGYRLRRQLDEKNGVEKLGLKVDCPNPDHSARRQCTRYRSTKMDVLKYGKQAPVVWLGCWLLNCYEGKTREAHKKYRPKAAEMDEFLSTYGDSMPKP